MTFKAHRGKQFCADCARIPRSVGNVMDFIWSRAQANCHDMVGKLPLSYRELRPSAPGLPSLGHILQSSQPSRLRFHTPLHCCLSYFSYKGPLYKVLNPSNA